MQNYPVNRFSTEKELKDYAKYWISALHLDDWIFSFKIVKNLTDANGDPCYGTSDYVMSNKTAVISIDEDMHEESLSVPFRPCAEKTLVHELLHLIYSPLMCCSGASYEQKMAELYEHTHIEQMAHTLICVKYGLPFEYFDKSKYTIPTED